MTICRDIQNALELCSLFTLGPNKFKNKLLIICFKVILLLFYIQRHTIIIFVLILGKLELDSILKQGFV